MNSKERINRLENHVDILNRLVHELVLEIRGNNPSLTRNDYGDIDGIDSDWDCEHIYTLLEKCRALPFFDPEQAGELIITN